ncbi:nucleotide-diphosphate-sugar epimerase [Lentzea pudingi]|uniref:Nucleotide-diphosphate-sugar epimerase n=1 Tax=Lentzea pudingi TaxID=1789439 RepID=A0ABQ2HWH3_9PSEU|nr:NAD(P)H-binding protein [Lentzea pudingi]GGM93746.1 nucleotide-diphosphate-sugar epimerase [Lentzea pudingi]
MSFDLDRTVLVTGATGKVGRHVVAGLLEAGARVRALVRESATAGLPGGVEVVAGDLHAPATVDAAARGTDAAFLLWPGFSADGAAQAVKALARHSSHLVHLSAARLQSDDGPTPGVWADVEALVAASGASWTFLRAGGFAANTLEWAEQIQRGDVIELPFPDAARSLVHERDIADVAVRALLDPALAGGAFPVTGPQVLTQREQVAAIGAALGRELRVREQSPEAARRAYAAVLGPDYAAAALAHWATLAERPERATDDVRRILGRPARTFREWARDHAGDFTA